MSSGGHAQTAGLVVRPKCLAGRLEVALMVLRELRGGAKAKAVVLKFSESPGDSAC